MPVDPTTGPPPWADSCRMLGDRIDRIDEFIHQLGRVSVSSVADRIEKLEAGGRPFVAIADDIEGLRLAIQACGKRIDLLIEARLRTQKKIDEVHG